MDCYSDWPTVIPVGKDNTASHMIAGLTELFSQTVIPCILWSDGGPQFIAKAFKSFIHQWGFHHQILTPHSNGKAQSSVKSMKKLIRAACNGRYLGMVYHPCKAIWSLCARHTPGS